MKKLTILISASVFALLTTGCTTVMTAGVKKGDERNLARSLNDVNASRAIKARMGRVEGFKLSGVDVEVAEGIVVLSGNVPREEDRIEAERIAWSGPAILQVGNEILIKERQGLVRNTKDGVLNNSVRARLIATKAVKARNYSIEVNDGVVYLLGVARTPQELAMATQIASTTKGTVEVISYVKVAADNSRMTAIGPGFNGEPSAAASIPNYQPLSQVPLQSAPLPQSAELPSLPTPRSTILDDDAIESGEPYYRDLVTGERITLPEGVKPIPYVPDAGPGSLGAGGAPLPPGTVSGDGAYNIDPLTGEMVPVSYQGQ
ncbi:MAG: BON domain-containing protein [Robiginitomaculum sp.]|nr:BON domain-containing protein [Robiginitomaculum sp.]